MGHAILVFGTLVAINLGLGYMASDMLIDDETQSQAVVEIKEVGIKAIDSDRDARTSSDGL